MFVKWVQNYDQAIINSFSRRLVNINPNYYPKILSWKHTKVFFWKMKKKTFFRQTFNQYMKWNLAQKVISGFRLFYLYLCLKLLSILVYFFRFLRVWFSIVLITMNLTLENYFFSDFFHFSFISNCIQGVSSQF